MERKKKWVWMASLIGILIIVLWKNMIESFGYATCDQLLNCKDCATYTTYEDGICYWCDNPKGGKSCQVWKNGANCDRSVSHCPASTLSAKEKLKERRKKE